MQAGIRHGFVSVGSFLASRLRRPLRAVLALALVSAALPACAQWEIEESHTTASLRGVANPGGGVAWASGTNGTVVRTEDGGYLWQTCAIPPGAEKLDFRGIQAFDENTAIVMSSGTGDLSRIYKTTDGCQTWKLIFTNPDKDGFFDALQFTSSDLGFVLGDPVTRGSFIGFALFVTQDGGQSFRFFPVTGNSADPKSHGAFAASNSSLFAEWPSLFFVTGGTAGPLLYRDHFASNPAGQSDPSTSSSLPLAKGESAGAFALAFLPGQAVGEVVGGDYKSPNGTKEAAAYTSDSGQHWTLSVTPPHGFRSAVAYDADHKTWITVGPNGTDISTDDGKNWRPLLTTEQDTPDADKNWNALALPFVVGPKGRIGKLRTNALDTRPAQAESKP